MTLLGLPCAVVVLRGADETALRRRAWKHRPAPETQALRELNRAMQERDAFPVLNEAVLNEAVLDDAPAPAIEEQVQREVQTAARETAESFGDAYATACTERALGFAEGRLGRWSSADRHLARALELFTSIGDGNGEARTRRLTAFLLNRRGRHDEALAHYRAAVELYRRTGWAAGLANVHNEIGWTYILVGEHAQALAECRLALGEHQALGDRSGQAAAWDSMGYAQHHLGAYDEALESFGHALRLYRSVCDRPLEADTLVHIGDTQQAAGRPADAEPVWRQALEILEDLGHPDADEVAERLRAYPFHQVETCLVLSCVNGSRDHDSQRSSG